METRIDLDPRRCYQFQLAVMWGLLSSLLGKEIAAYQFQFCIALLLPLDRVGIPSG